MIEATYSSVTAVTVTIPVDESLRKLLGDAFSPGRTELPPDDPDDDTDDGDTPIIAGES